MMIVAGGILFLSLYAEDVMGKGLGTDEERISPVSLRPTSILFAFRFVWIVLGGVVLAAVYGTCERRIRRGEGRKP